MKFLCFSDVHGNVDAVRAMIDDVRKNGARYDAVIAAGDLTNAVITRDLEDAKARYDAMMSMLEQEYGRVYYVPGNRDYTGRGKNRKTFMHDRGILIEQDRKFEVSPGIYITSTPGLADRNTILVQHSSVRYLGRFKRISIISGSALLHISGHTHTGIHTNNYLNTCFLYRDGSNGAEPMLGGYFEVDIDTGTKEVRVMFHALGPVKQKPLKMDNFKGSVYAPYGNSFPVSLSIE